MIFCFLSDTTFTMELPSKPNEVSATNHYFTERPLNIHLHATSASISPLSSSHLKKSSFLLEENCFSPSRKEEDEADGETETEEIGSGDLNWARKRRKRRNRKSHREREMKRRRILRSRRTIQSQWGAREHQEDPTLFRRPPLSPNVPDEELMSLLKYLDEDNQHHNERNSQQPSQIDLSHRQMDETTVGNGSMVAAASPVSASGDSGYDCCPPSVGSMEDQHQQNQCQQRQYGFQNSDEQLGDNEQSAMFPQNYSGQTNATDDILDQVLKSIGTCSASDMQDLCKSFQEEEMGLMEQHQQQQSRGFIVDG